MSPNTQKCLSANNKSAVFMLFLLLCFFIDVSNSSARATDTFRIDLDNHSNPVEAVFKQQYWPICTSLIRSVDQVSIDDLCTKTIEVIYQVSTHLNATPKAEIERSFSCDQSWIQSTEVLLSCIEQQAGIILTLITEGIEMAMCAFPNSTVFLNDDGGYYSRRIHRGTQIYREHKLIVDCVSNQFAYLYSEGFYPESLLLDAHYEYQWDDYFESLHDALYVSNQASIEKFIKSYVFGEDEGKDKKLLEILVADVAYFPWLQQLTEIHKPQLNFAVDYYQQPLSLAILSDNEPAALLFLQSGADPLVPGEFGASILTLASRSGMNQLVSALLAKGMDPDGVTGSDNLNFGQPLVGAAERGDQAMFDLLLQQGAKVQPLHPDDYPNWKHDELLSQTIRSGNLNILETLFDHGIQATATKRTWVSLISVNKPEVMTFLRSKNLNLPPADQHEVLFDALSNVIDRANLSTLERAYANFNSMEAAGFDLSQSFNPNKSLGYQLVFRNLTSALTWKNNPEDEALKQLRNDFAQAALKAAIKDGIDINQSNENKTTLLMHAARLGQHEIIKSLLNYGADTQLKDEEGRTALEIAEKQVAEMTAYHPQDLLMQKKYKASIALLKEVTQID